MVNQKTQRWADALAEALALRLGATYTVTKGYDAADDKNVYVSAALAAGGNNSVDAIIKFAPAAAPASGAKDSLGLTQTVYSPHVAKVLFDITASDGTPNAVRAKVMVEVARLGTGIEVYDKTAGAANIVLADITAANIIATIDDLAWGSLANV